LILLILSIAIHDPLTNEALKDSLNKFVAPRFIAKQMEVYKMHPDHLKYFGPNRKIRMAKAQGEETLQPFRKIRANGCDTVRIAAIRVEFLEDTTSLTTGSGRFKLTSSRFLCDTTYDTTVVGADTLVDTTISRNLAYDPPHDSTYFNRLMEFLHNYYRKVSYNQLWIEWELLPYGTNSGYSLPHEMKYYGNPDNFVLGFFKLLRDAVEVADYTLDFSDFDEIIIFHAGAPWQTDLLGDSPYDLIAAQGSGMHEIFGSYLIADGDTIDSGILMPETNIQDSLVSFMQGTLCHEFGHSDALGFWDLYDVSYETMGMGGWALMGSGNWNFAGLIPPRLCSYHRLEAGFDEPVVIESTAASLPIKWAGSMDSTTPRIYKVPINSDEYFLIENRFAYFNPDTIHYVIPCTTNIDSNGYRVWKDNVLVDVDDYESSLPLGINSGGLAIWHIDERKIAVAETLNMINVGYPKGVDLEEADGIQDFEKDLYKIQDWTAATYGSPLDVFSADGFNYEFSPTTDPSTHDNFGNWTGITIGNISLPDTIMYFDVSFNRIFSGFPKKFGGKMDVISPQNVDSTIYTGDMWGAIYTANPDDTVFRMVEITDSLYEDSTYTSPLITDITGDGDLELFDMTIKGKIFLYDISSDILLDSSTVTGQIYGNASAADLLPGGGKEILFGTSASELHLLRWDGDSLIEADGFPLYVGDWVVSTPLVIGNSIYVLPADGTLLKVSVGGEIIWRKGEENVSYSLSSPVAGDIDRDGVKEILCSAGSSVIFAVDTAGGVEWKKTLPAKTYFSTPALGDINGDGYLDVIFADSANIFALNRNGALVDNFPIKIHLSRQAQSSIVLSDVSGDSLLDIVFGSPDGGVFAYNGEGEKVARFPFATGRRSYSTPLVFDPDGDGRSELFIGSDDGWLYGWETDGYYRSDGWNRIYFNNDHQSVFPNSLLPLRFDEEGELAIEEFYIYPSPVRGGDEAHVRFSLSASAENVVIRIYSLSGRLITEKRVAGFFGPNDVKIDRDLSSEANGIYIVTIDVDNRVFDKFKFGLLNRF
jgi:M6 family metalloprotease-like protein